ncbi:hypothetical protein D3C86_2262500 [compost metagenome]
MITMVITATAMETATIMSIIMGMKMGTSAAMAAMNMGRSMTTIIPAAAGTRKRGTTTAMSM